MEHDPRDDNYDFEDDPEDEAFMDCGMLAEGGCSLVGTEYCDWECPFSASMMAAAIRKFERKDQG